MFLVDLVSWWYLKGWGVYFGDYKRRLKDTIDFFSIGEMVKTLFKPYKQIAAGANSAVDRLISRFVGFFARVMVILAGLLALILEGIIGVVIAVAWLIIPLMPVAGIILAIVGVKF